MTEERIRQIRVKWYRTGTYKKVPFNKYLEKKSNR